MLVKALLLAYAALAKSKCTETIYRKDADDYTDAEWAELAKAVDLAMNTIVDGFDKDGNQAKVSFWESQGNYHDKIADEIHSTPFFFPFHRRFLLETESFLRKLNPNFKAFPYYNELLHANAPYTPSAIKNTAAMNKYGKDRTYTKSPDTLMTYDQFQGYISDAEGKDGFAYFARWVEVQHGYLHNDLGGTIKSMYSPKDPMFYLHHACYDRFWSLAQSVWAAKDSTIPQWTDFNGNSIDFNTYLPGYDGSCENKDKCTFSEVFSCNDICVVYVPKGETPPAVTTTVALTTTVAPTTTVAHTTAAPTTAPTTAAHTTAAPTTVAPTTAPTTTQDSAKTSAAQGTTTQPAAATTNPVATTQPADKQSSADIAKGTVTSSAPATTTTAVVYPVIPPSIYPPTTQCHSQLSADWIKMLNLTDSDLQKVNSQCQTSYDNAKNNVPVQPIPLIPACDQEQHLAKVVAQQQYAQSVAPTLPNYPQQTADDSEDCDEDEETTTDVGAAYGQATDLPTVQTTGASYDAPVVSYAEKASAGLFMLALFFL
ncbi:hypothetical protein HDV01_000808 [Terramyces sp. JEL0728]|nr:hypothetical protein HDV01_000808 [Terramyces sp. JEL0728]